MDVRKLRYFVAVAEELNFSRAARRLSISQPPLSTQIKELEAELGVQLLERSSREVKLTGPGATFLAKCRAILEQMDAAVLSTQREAAGGAASIRMGVVGSALFSAAPTLVAHIKRRFPQARISLCEAGSSEQLTAVLRDQLDIGVVHAPVDTPRLASRLISEEPYVLAVPRGHARARRARARLADFAAEPFVCFSREWSPVLFDNVIVACRRAGFSPDMTHTARHVLTMLQMVRMGLGVALVPGSARQAGVPEVAFLALDDPVGPVQLCAVWREKPAQVIADIVAELERGPGG